MTRAAIYVRISHDSRVGSLDEGLGVQDQEIACRELAERLGYDVTTVLPDNDVSAYSGKTRPKYQKLLSLVQSGEIDAVLCWHTDRLHRSNTELEEYINVVEPRNITTETVKAGAIDLNTPVGRMVARQLCTIARYESEHRAERVALARQRQARKGKFGGGRRPYGFEADGITVREEEASEIVRMAHAVLSGVSLRSIAHDLRSRRIMTANGIQWVPNAVRAVLLRPRNAGFMVHRETLPRKGAAYSDSDIIGSAPWAPILPEDVWRSVVAKLTDPERRTTPGPAPKHLGSGIYRCACGNVMRVHNAGGRTKTPYYRCAQTGKGHVTAPRVEMDDFVKRVVIERLSRKDAASLVVATTGGVDVAALRAELQRHRDRLDEIAADYDDDKITRSQMLTQTERRRAKIERIEMQLTESTELSPLTKLIGAADVKEAWEDLTLGERRAALQALFTIRVLPAGRGSRLKVHDRVKFEPVQPAPNYA